MTADPHEARNYAIGPPLGLRLRACYLWPEILASLASLAVCWSYQTDPNCELDAPHHPSILEENLSQSRYREANLGSTG